MQRIFLLGCLMVQSCVPCPASDFVVGGRDYDGLLIISIGEPIEPNWMPSPPTPKPTIQTETLPLAPVTYQHYTTSPVFFGTKLAPQACST